MKLRYIVPILLAFGCSDDSNKKDDSSETFSTKVVYLPQTNANDWYLGSGYNSLKGGYAFKNRCLDRGEIIYQGGHPTNSLALYFKSIKTQDDFFQTQNMDLDAKINIAKKSTISGTSKKFENIVIHKDKSYALVIGKKVWSTEGLKDYKFNQDQLNVIKNNPKQFFNRCGDTFISDLSRSTEVYGLLECSHYSKDHRESIEREISGGSSNPNAAISSASIKSKLSKINIVSRGSCTLFATVRGGGDKKIPTKFETFVENMVNLLGESKYEEAQPSKLFVKRYENTITNQLALNIIEDNNKDFNERFIVSLTNMDKHTIEAQIDEVYNLHDLKKTAIAANSQNVIRQVDSKLKRVRSSIDESYRSYEKCIDNPYIPQNCGIDPGDDDEIIED